MQDFLICDRGKLANWSFSADPKGGNIAFLSFSTVTNGGSPAQCSFPLSLDLYLGCIVDPDRLSVEMAQP